MLRQGGTKKYSHQGGSTKLLEVRLLFGSAKRADVLCGQDFVRTYA